MSTVGSRIRERRLALGISVDELAKRLGKNRATVYRYESDDIENLPVSIITPLALVLETTPAYIMGWSDDVIGVKPTFSEFIDLDEVLPEDEVRLVELYRLADEIDKQTIRNILSRYDEKRSTAQSSIV